MNDGERAENEAVRAVIRALIREAADQTCRANRLLAEVEGLLRADTENGEDSAHSDAVRSAAVYSETAYSEAVHTDAAYAGTGRSEAARPEAARTTAHSDARPAAGRALGPGAPPLPQERFPDLTERERQVLSLLLGGKANRQIARQLGITERTVKNHLRAVFIKLGVSDRTSAVIKILDEGALNGTVPDRGA